MTENRNLTCIVCPIGCNMEVTLEENQVKSVKGQGCRRGAGYAFSECINPTRTLTTTVKVESGQLPLVPVKSEKPIPKELLMECMKVINGIRLAAPVKLGDVVVENILDTGINIVASGNNIYIEEQ